MPRPPKPPKPGQQLALDLPGVKKPKVKSMSGTVLNGYIVAHLLFRGCKVAWRQNVGGAVYEDEDTGRRQYVQFGFKGLSDVIGIAPDGRFIAVEGKVEDDLSPEQEAFIALVNATGAIGRVVRPDDYKQILDDALDVPQRLRWERGE